MPVVEFESVSLNYECMGDPARPVVLLMHSLGADLKLWDPQVRALRESFYMVRYDARGHGTSSTPPGPYTQEDLGQDALRLMDHLNLQKVFAGGVSLGGQTALWLGIHSPERLLGLVAANTAAKIGTAEGWDERILQVQRDGVASLVDGALSRWFTPRFLAANPGLDDLVRYNMASKPVEGYAACCAALRNCDLRRTVRMIAAPTLVIAGVHDLTTPLSEAQFLNKSIGGSQLVELDAAHLSNVEKAQEFTQAIASFFNSLL